MSGFESKRALLEYLGKNTDDRKLIKRMIERGEVYEEGGMFYLSEKVESGIEKKEDKSEPKESENKQSMDDKELKELREKHEKLVAAYKDLLSRNEGLKKRCKDEMERADAQWGLYDHLVFFYGKFKEWKKFVDGKVFGQTQYDLSRGIQQKEELVRDGMYEKYKFKFGDVEQAECDAVEKIIAKRAEEKTGLPF